MGLHNQSTHYKKFKNLQDGLCPICSSKILIHEKFKLEEDCIHYECSVCSPLGAIISISGAVLLNEEMYEKILNNNNFKTYLKDKIQKAEKGEIVEINCNDFS